MTLDFNELNIFLKSVFKIFFYMHGNLPIDVKDDNVWDELNVDTLVMKTAEKCFQDCKLVKGTGEVNYTQFTSWMSGEN